MTEQAVRTPEQREAKKIRRKQHRLGVLKKKYRGHTDLYINDRKIDWAELNQMSLDQQLAWLQGTPWPQISRRETIRQNRAEKRRIRQEQRLQKKLNRIRNIIQHVNVAADVQTFLCIDLEQFERAQHRLTEIGLTTYCVKTKRIKTKHIIVEEYYNNRNGKFVPDNKDNFLHGDSVTLSLADALDEVQRVINQHTHVVGHAIGSDLRYLSKKGIDTTHLTTLDTRGMYQVAKMKSQTRKLSVCCSEFGLNHIHTHNAGNDSHINMYLFVVLRKIISQLNVEEVVKLAA